MKKNQIDIITMGCSKNLVDSERLVKRFEEKGYRCNPDPRRPQGEIAVINTCGFIEAAKEESIQTILQFAKRKEQGRLAKLYVMGCLSQRYQEELETEIPEVDKFYGKFNFTQLLDELPEAASAFAADRKRQANAHTRLTPKHYAYLKIAEGCDRKCAYCAIPLITGRHTSRSEEEIIQEVKQQVAQGVKEFQVIEQELTYYGRDLDGKAHIAKLIERIAHIEGVEWIRLHYAYPNQFPMELLEVIARNNNVCKYLDIALQHISERMLKRMKRNVGKQETIELIHKIRQEVPGIHLRTTLMVGFPGETEEDFQELMDFVKEERFERMGAFAYSEEEGTYSQKHYPDDVPPHVKQERLDKLMALQQEISAEIQAERIGHIMKVIIDRKEGAYYIGRTEYCSPDVDPEVLIPATQKLRIGNFYNVKITDSEEFDLYGEII